MTYFLKISSWTPKRVLFQVITGFVVFLSDKQTKIDSTIELSAISDILFVCYSPNRITNFFCFYTLAEKRLCSLLEWSLCIMRFNSSRVSSHHVTTSICHNFPTSNQNATSLGKVHTQKTTTNITPTQPNTHTLIY